MQEQPHWERGYRCHGFWIGIKRIGHISLSPEHYKPLICSWSFSLPHDDAVSGQAPNVRKAKQLVERAYKQYRRVDKFKAGQLYEVLDDWASATSPFFRIQNARYELRAGETIRFKCPNMGYAVFYDTAGKVVYLKPKLAFRIVGRIYED